MTNTDLNIKNCPNCKKGTMILIYAGFLHDTFKCNRCEYKVEQPDPIQIILG